jgi:hypothetical protein
MKIYRKKAFIFQQRINKHLSANPRKVNICPNSHVAYEDKG